MIKSTFNHSKTVALTTLSRFGGLAEWLGCLVAVAVILGIGGPRHKSVETRLLAITPPPLRGDRHTRGGGSPTGESRAQTHFHLQTPQGGGAVSPAYSQGGGPV